MLSEVHRNFPVPDITGPVCREFHRRYPRQTVGQTGKPLQVPDSGHVLPFFACPDCQSAKNGNPVATASDGGYPETMRNPRFSWRIPAVFPEECGIIDRPALKNSGRKNEKRIHAAGIQISLRYRLYCRSSADLLR